MYIEEPKRKINWGSLVKKGLIILLIAIVIFLIIWLFTRNNSNSIKVDYENNNSNEILPNQDSYSEIFINNYRYFHDTAKEYFLVSELPKNGKEIKYTLQELIDKKLILPFNYKDSTCDTKASYVVVKNTNGKYEMITTLLCGKETAQTKEELGCNQLCENGTCNIEEILYQYKQPYTTTETTYSCPTGYTKNGTKCVKDNSTTVNATKTITYTCENGYTKNGTSCTKDNTTYVDAKETVTYSCPTGYTKNGTKCYKNDSDSINANYNYTYSCPAGYTKSGSGANTKCIKTVTNTVNATSDTTYSCPTGYTKNGTKCIKEVTTYVDAIPNIKVYCPNGYTKDGNSCIKYIYTTISYGPSYEGCTGGQYVTSSCTTGNCVTGKYMYKCTEGVESSTKYYCADGSTPNANNKCAKTDIKEINATVNTSYSCANGVLSGSTCKITSTKNAEVIKEKAYSCPSGYTLNGNKCTKTTSSSIDATKNVTYSCDSNSKLSGNKCVSYNNTTKPAIKTTTYNCEEGYTKYGVGSTSVCTKGSTTTIDATKSTKKITKYKYKWSKETSLNGWEKTGVTKVSSK